MVIVDAQTSDVSVEPLAIPKAHWRRLMFKWLGRVRNRIAFGIHPHTHSHPHPLLHSDRAHTQVK